MMAASPAMMIVRLMRSLSPAFYRPRWPRSCELLRSPLLSLRVLHVHLRIGAVRGGFGVADVDRQAHVGEHGAQRREAQHHVVRPAAVAHQADAPDLARQ